MFIDTSAFVAILSQETDAARFSNAIEVAAEPVTSALVRLETIMVMTGFNRGAPLVNLRYFDKLVVASDIKFADITEEMGRIAVAAFAKFGKGMGHPAQLNLADCMAYAVAKAKDIPILFKGNDFSRTDLRSALK